MVTDVLFFCYGPDTLWVTPVSASGSGILTFSGVLFFIIRYYVLFPFFRVPFLFLSSPSISSYDPHTRCHFLSYFRPLLQ